MSKASANCRARVQGYASVVWAEERSLFSGDLSLLRGISDRAVVLHGLQYSKVIAERLCAAYRIPAERCSPVAEATEAQVSDHLQKRSMDECTTLVAVGGGRVQDVAKLVARRSGKALIVVPTIVATDGVASPVSVMRDPRSGSVSLGAKAPDSVILCWALLARVPVPYWRALVGDVVGNLVAVRDFRRFGADTLDAAARTAVERSCGTAEKAALRIIEFDDPDFGNEAFRRMLVGCAVESSFAMVDAGTSQPCSGSEHLLSHAIDSLRLPPGWLHGLQVGAAVPSCLALHGENALRKDVERLYSRLAMPRSLPALGGAIEPRLSEIVRIAPDMRPGRGTVLTRYAPDELVRRLSAR